MCLQRNKEVAAGHRSPGRHDTHSHPALKNVFRPGPASLLSKSRSGLIRSASSPQPLKEWAAGRVLAVRREEDRRGDFAVRRTAPPASGWDSSIRAFLSAKENSALPAVDGP